MNAVMEKLEAFGELGGINKDITFLVIFALARIASLTGLIPGLPFDPAFRPPYLLRLSEDSFYILYIFS